MRHASITRVSTHLLFSIVSRTSALRRISEMVQCCLPLWRGMVWYGMVGPDQSLAIIMVGPLGRVGQRLLLRVVLLAPSQIIVGTIPTLKERFMLLSLIDVF